MLRNLDIISTSDASALVAYWKNKVPIILQY